MKKKILFFTTVLMMMTFIVASAKELDKQWDITLDKVWKITMSDEIDSSTVDGQVAIYQGDTLVTISTSVKGKVIYVKADELFKSQTEYLLLVNDGIKSMKKMKLKDKVQMYFQTGNKLSDGSENKPKPPTEDTEYAVSVGSHGDFNWNYNRDYTDFTMVGKKMNGNVVAGYTIDKNESYGLPIKIGMTRDQASSKIGESFNSLPDHYIVHYVHEEKIFSLFFDKHEKDTLRAILWQNKEYFRANSIGRGTEEKRESERLMFDLINSFRVSKGLSPFLLSYNLEKMARGHSLDMAVNNFYAHTNPQGVRVRDRAEKLGITLRFGIGENIHYGYGNIIFSHEAFVDSLGHRRSLLNESFVTVGVGVEDNIDTTPYITINFSGYMEP